MLFKTQELERKEIEVIALIDELKSKLSYALRQPTRWLGILRRSTFAKALRGSNSIEGYIVSPDDALAAAQKEEPLDEKTEAWLAVNCYREAMTYVLQLAGDPYFRYSTDLLKSLHYMMLQYNLSKGPGQWRPGYIAVRDEEKNEVMYEGPDADHVPTLMDELIESLNTDDGKVHAMVRGAMGHLNLVMIHPFRDGNGRMARCLQTLILTKTTGTLAPEFCSIEEYLGHNTREYYDVLQGTSGKAWNPKGDTRRWIQFCLTAHYRQAMTLLKRTKEMQRLWEMLESEVKKKGLHERTMMALMDAAIGYKVRNPTYRSAAEISDQVASRDLKELVTHGLLLPTGVKRGRFYTASELIKHIRESTREPRGIADPFGLSS
jgi:Fic family protein